MGLHQEDRRLCFKRSIVWHSKGLRFEFNTEDLYLITSLLQNTLIGEKCISKHTVTILTDILGDVILDYGQLMLC